MNWMEFVSSIVKSIIWPLAITIIIIILKSPVSNLMRTLAKIKYKDWEFEFVINKKLDSLNEQISDNQSNDKEDQSEDTDGRADNMVPVSANLWSLPNMNNERLAEFDKNMRILTRRYTENSNQIKNSITFLNNTIDDLYKRTVTEEEVKDISSLEKVNQLVSKGILTNKHRIVYLEMVNLSKDMYFVTNLHTVDKFKTNVSLFAEKIKKRQVEKKTES